MPNPIEISVLYLDSDNYTYFGLILLCPSGVVYQNQSGGIHCIHPEAEGAYIPLPTHWKPVQDPLEDLWFPNNDPGGLVLVEEFLQSGSHLPELFVPRVVNSSTEYGEAWVPVTIRPGAHTLLVNLDEYAGKEGFLVYLNSD